MTGRRSASDSSTCDEREGRSDCYPDDADPGERNADRLLRVPRPVRRGLGRLGQFAWTGFGSRCARYGWGDGHRDLRRLGVVLEGRHGDRDRGGFGGNLDTRRPCLLARRRRLDQMRPRIDGNGRSPSRAADRCESRLISSPVSGFFTSMVSRDSFGSSAAARSRATRSRSACPAALAPADASRNRAQALAVFPSFSQQSARLKSVPTP